MRLRRCSACGAEILFARHEGSGNWMPLERAADDAEGVLWPLVAAVLLCRRKS